MLNLNISLTSLAVILWSGMMVIAGSIWILSSQVRKLADLIEAQGKDGGRADVRAPRLMGDGPATGPTRRATLRVVERPAARAN